MGDEKEAESEEIESWRLVETVWTAVPPDYRRETRREREHTGMEREIYD